MSRNHAFSVPGTVALILSSTLASAAAHAQTAGDSPKASADAPADGPQLEEVVVTGSRIKRQGFDTVQPALVTDSQELERQGITNIGDALAETPGFGVSGASSSSNQSPFGVGATFVDFFGLGSQRTLTLVDGRRYVSSNAASGFSTVNPGGQVDLGLIPLDLIERIETVATGGAPIYGADAIAGTVNIILNDKFDGARFRGEYGTTEHGGAQSKSFGLLLGHDLSDSGHVVFSAQYDRQSGLQDSARDFLEHRPFLVSNPNNTGPHDGISAQQVLPDRVFAGLTDGGVPVPQTPAFGPLPAGSTGSLLPQYPHGLWVFDNAGNPLQFGPNGTLVPYRLGTGPLTTLAGSPGLLDAPITMSGGDGMRREHNNLIAPSNRTLLNLLAHYDVAPGVQAFTELAYAHSHAEERELVSAYTSAFGFELPLSVNNAFLAPQDRQTLINNGVSTFDLSRTMNDITDYHAANTSQDVYRLVAGLRGGFDVAGHRYSWEVSYNYGESYGRSQLVYVNDAHLQAAADAVIDPATGKAVCASGAPGCVPIDLFGVGHETPEAIGYVTDIGSGVNVNKQQDAVATLSGALPFGIAAPIEFSTGYEHRKESADFRPDSVMLAGAGLIPPILPVHGDYSTNEVYAETLIPILAPERNLPVVKSFSLEGSARYVDNSRAGGDTTWSVGTRFAPQLPGWGDGLTFRAVRTRAIRAPAITELFLTAAGGLSTANDPCDKGFVQSGPNPGAREANCRAALTAAGITDPAQFNSLVVNTGQLGTASGNPNLQNEIADSWSAGVVYQPTNAPHLHLAADWVDIKLRNGIEYLELEQLLDACYDSAKYPNVPACNQFTRGTGVHAGQITDFHTGFINSSSTHFAGMMLDGDYFFNLGGGMARVDAKLFHVAKFDQELFAGSTVNLQGTVDSTGTYPNYQAQLDLQYHYKKLTAGWTMNYMSPEKISNTATYETNPANEVPSYLLARASLAYDITSVVRVQLVVNNALDRNPPLSVLVAGGDQRYRAYDLLGRRYFLSAYAKF